MAGKHIAVFGGLVNNTVPAVYPGRRDDRAYSEGRQSERQGGSTGDNPHPTGTPENQSWLIGFALGGDPDLQIQTCWV